MNHSDRRISRSAHHTRGDVALHMLMEKQGSIRGLRSRQPEHAASIAEVTNATRRQERILEQAEATGRAHRTGIRESRCVRQGSRTARLGDGERHDAWREEVRLRPRSLGESRSRAQGRAHWRTQHVARGTQSRRQEGVGDAPASRELSVRRRAIMPESDACAECGTDTDGATSISRRRVLSRLTVALGAVSAALVAWPIVGFLFDPLARRAQGTWRTVGRTAEFPPGSTRQVAFLDPTPLPWAGQTAATASWLRHEAGGDFIAFSVNCTHLGCPVRWEQGPQLFMCPCHGGVFYADGSPASGPPLRALARYPVRVVGGTVQIWTGPLPIE